MIVAPAPAMGDFWDDFANVAQGVVTVVGGAAATAVGGPVAGAAAVAAINAGASAIRKATTPTHSPSGPAAPPPDPVVVDPEPDPPPPPPPEPYRGFTFHSANQKTAVVDKFINDDMTLYSAQREIDDLKAKLAAASAGPPLLQPPPTATLAPLAIATPTAPAKGSALPIAAVAVAGIGAFFLARKRGLI